MPNLFICYDFISEQTLQDFGELSHGKPVVFREVTYVFDMMN